MSMKKMSIILTLAVVVVGFVLSAQALVGPALIADLSDNGRTRQVTSVTIQSAPNPAIAIDEEQVLVPSSVFPGIGIGINYTSATVTIENLLTTPTLQQIGYTTPTLEQIGYTTPTLQQIGYTTPTLQQIGYTTPTLEQIGYTTPTLQQIGYTTPNLQQVMEVAQETSRTIRFDGPDGLDDYDGLPLVSWLGTFSEDGEFRAIMGESPEGPLGIIFRYSPPTSFPVISDIKNAVAFQANNVFFSENAIVRGQIFESDNHVPNVTEIVAGSGLSRTINGSTVTLSAIPPAMPTLQQIGYTTPTLQQITDAGDTTTRTINANRLATSTTLRMNGLATDPAGVQSGDQWFRSSDQRFVASYAGIRVVRGGTFTSLNPANVQPTLVSEFSDAVISGSEFNIDKTAFNQLPAGQSRSFRVRMGFAVDQTGSPGTASPVFILNENETPILTLGTGDVPWPQLGSNDFGMYSLEYTITCDNTNVWYTGFVASDTGQTRGYSGIAYNVGPFADGLTGRVRWFNTGSQGVSVEVTSCIVELLD
jgi:hypothetical protein